MLSHFVSLRLSVPAVVSSQPPLYRGVRQPHCETKSTAPRPGLCIVCHVEPRAPGQYRCQKCQAAWDRRHTNGKDEHHAQR